MQKRQVLAIDQIKKRPLVEDEDIHKLRRIFGYGHDIWSNRNGQSFVVGTVTYINTITSPWTLERVMSLTPHKLPDHATKSNLEVCMAQLKELGIGPENLVTTCSDTTGNAVNVFDTVPFVGQLLCCSHTIELILFHGVKNDFNLSQGFDYIHKTLVRAKGQKRSKRQILLQ